MPQFSDLPAADHVEDMATACLDAMDSDVDEAGGSLQQPENRDPQNEWERHVGEMAAWMMNSGAQRDFLQ